LITNIFKNSKLGGIDAFISIQKHKSVKEVINSLKHINGGPFGLMLVDNLEENGNIGYISLSEDVYQNYSNLNKFGYEYGWNLDYGTLANLIKINKFEYIINPESGYIASINKE